MAQQKPTPVAELGVTDDETGALNVIIETPKGSRNKFKYDEKLGVFRLSGVLPAGAGLPLRLRLYPVHARRDGDPLDVLLLMDEPAFAGCLVPARLIGVIEAEQTGGRQDRAQRPPHRRRRRLARPAPYRDPGPDQRNLVEEIEHFFVSYNTIKGKQFAPKGRFGPERAQKLVDAGQAQAKRKARQ